MHPPRGMHLSQARSSTVEFGNVDALFQVAKKIGFVEAINRAAPKRSGLPVGQLVLILVINRCVDPLAKWEVPEWYRRTYLPELLHVELPLSSGYQTLTRCLSYLTESAQQDIEVELARNTLRAYNLKPGVFLYDVSSSFVEGEGDVEILQYGYSRDHRPDCKQLNIGLCVSMPEVVPLFHEVFPGNLADSTTLKATMVRFQDQTGLDGCLVIDRGIVTHSNIEEIVDVRGLDLVGGLRLDVSLKARIAKAVLDSYGPAFTRGKESLRAREFPLLIRGKKRRGILYYSKDKDARDKKARAKALAAVRKEFDGIAAALAREGRGRKPEAKSTRRKIEKLLEERRCEKLVEWKFTGGRGGRRLKWRVDEKAVKEAEKLDGKYVLVTTLDKSPKGILELYRSRDGVERAFRMLKGPIKIRPIWSRNGVHIEAHVFLCYLAMLLMSLLQLMVREKGYELTAVKALKKLAGYTKKVRRPVGGAEGTELHGGIFAARS
jgi:transposase